MGSEMCIRDRSVANQLTVDDLATSLGQSTMAGNLSIDERERHLLESFGEVPRSDSSLNESLVRDRNKQQSNLVSSRSDVVSLASTLANDLAHLVETMNLGEMSDSLANSDSLRPHSSLVARAAYAGAKNLSRGLGVTNCPPSACENMNNAPSNAVYTANNSNSSSSNLNQGLTPPPAKRLFPLTENNQPDNRYVPINMNNVFVHIL